MLIEGKIEKDEKFWLASVPFLDLMTQGLTRKEAYLMLQNVVVDLVNKKDFKVKILSDNKNQGFLLNASEQNELIALMLRRQRQKYGLTLQEVAERLGSNSPNAYARYEQGKAKPTLTKLQELLNALDPSLEPILKLAA